MTTFEKISERASFYGITCQAFLEDVACIFEQHAGREGRRKAEVLSILEDAREGIRTAEIAAALNIKPSNVASVLMELRKAGQEILNINGLMILGKYVNIG